MNSTEKRIAALYEKLEPIIRIKELPLVPWVRKEGQLIDCDDANLPPRDYFEKVRDAQLESQSVLDDRYSQLENAYEKLGAEGVTRIAERNIELIREIAEELPAVEWKSRCPYNTRLAKLLARKIGWTEMSIFDELEEGVRLAGVQNHSPTLSLAKRIKRPNSLEELLRRSEDVSQRSLEQTNLDPQHKEEIMKEQRELEEADKVRIMSVEEFGKLTQRKLVSPTFANVELDKLRVISNYRMSGLNQCASVLSKMSLQDLRHLMEIVRRFSRFFREPLLFKADESGAYRAIKIHPDEAGLLSTAIDKETVVLNLVLTFGHPAAVYRYLLYSYLNRSLILAFTGCPSMNYIDDAGAVTGRGCAKSAPTLESLGNNKIDKRQYKLYREFHVLLGILLKDHKCCPPIEELKMLGLHAEVVAGQLKLTISDGTCRHVQRVIKDILDSGKLSPPLAQKLAGLLNFISTATPSRLGRAQMVALYAVKNPVTRLSEDLRNGLTWWYQAANALRLGKFQGQIIRSCQEIATPSVVVVDASDSYGAGVLALRRQPTTKFFALNYPLPDDAIGTQSDFREAHTLIVFLMIVSLIVSTGSTVMVLEDNSGVLGSVFKGRSGANRYLNAVGSFWHTIQAVSGIQLHISWVPSKLNVADLGTRPDRGWQQLIDTCSATELSPPPRLSEFATRILTDAVWDSTDMVTIERNWLLNFIAS